MITKRSYDLTAKVLGNWRNPAVQSLVETKNELIARMAQDFADLYALDNPKFNREKFLETIAKRGGVIP